MVVAKEDVYHIVENEQLFQRTSYNGIHFNHTFAEYAVRLFVEIELLHTAIAQSPDGYTKHDAIRNIAAIALSCAEHHGIRRR